MASPRSSAGRSAEGARRTRNRRTGLILSLVVVVVVTALLLAEQVALLYVLATLSVAALLLVVAFASFGEARANVEPAPFDDAAAIADRTAPAIPAAAPRRAVNRS